MGYAPGTPHPKSGVSFPKGFAVGEQEEGEQEGGYEVPRGPYSPTTPGGYTPVSPHTPRDCQDPLPVTPAPTPGDDEYEEPVRGEGNTYECIDDVLERINSLQETA